MSTRVETIVIADVTAMGATQWGGGSGEVSKWKAPLIFVAPEGITRSADFVCAFKARAVPAGAR